MKPQMVVETEFRGVTHDGLLRQAVVQGAARGQAGARSGARDARSGATRGAAPCGAQIAAGGVKQAQRAKARRPRRHDRQCPFDPSRPGLLGRCRRHQGRILAEYYVSVWDVMAPHVVDRPLAIVRAPEGIGGELFFQKHIAANIKESPLRHVVDAKEHDVIAVEKLDDLIALVQSGALEIHTRGSRLGRLEVCDRIVFDLDPGEGVSWKANRRGGAGDARPAQGGEAQKLRQAFRRQGHSRRGADRRRRLGHRQGVRRAHRQRHGRRLRRSVTSPR